MPIDANFTSSMDADFCFQQFEENFFPNLCHAQLKFSMYERAEAFSVWTGHFKALDAKLAAATTMASNPD